MPPDRKVLLGVSGASSRAPPATRPDADRDGVGGAGYGTTHAGNARIKSKYLIIENIASFGIQKSLIHAMRRINQIIFCVFYALVI